MAMTRMIDADVLKDKAETCRETTYDFQSLIDAAPAIDAIPVGWLREKMMNDIYDSELSESAANVLWAWQKEQEERA